MKGQGRARRGEPVRAKSVTHVLGIKSYLCARNGPDVCGGPSGVFQGISKPGRLITYLISLQ
jgi:hypothetical protein